ncbi:mucin-6 isoform X4 [Stomoxys calcitrans]|uniref:mucin-6 isoform X4 n=1 Tax=Stomoxys calcitrans TaxID=35570 RepID=UPI0027E26BD6|nr:mucin-6 isoform X4 [Stomoxys calcitrans]
MKWSFLFKVNVGNCEIENLEKKNIKHHCGYNNFQLDNMSSRNKTDVKKLFEYWCEVSRTQGGIEQTNSLRYNGGGTSVPVGVITESFPENFRDEKTIQDIPAFAFPCEFESDSVQSYSFVLTTDDSKWRFGFCRHDPKTESTMVIITFLPWHDTFLRLLGVLAELRRTDPKEFHQFLTEAYSSGVPDVGSKLILKYSQEQSEFKFERPKPFQLPSIPENHNLNLYYNFVDPKNMIAVFAAMLAERRIIFTSSRLDRLSSCIQAANAFLYPMVWQHIFIPVLPMKLKDYLSAPMPYLIGVPHLVLETMTPDELGEVVTLNCDTKIFDSPFDDVHAMPAEIVSQLKKQLSHSNQHIGDRVSKIFLGVLVQLIGGYRDAVEFRDMSKTFNRDKFIESRPSHLRPFLTKMMELQIFQQFIDERLEMMNTGLGFSDEFEQETVRYAEKLKKRGRFHQLKEKIIYSAAFQTVKESSRVAKHAYKDLKSKFRDITPPHPAAQHPHHNNNNFRSHLNSNTPHDRMDGVSVGSYVTGGSKDSKSLKSYLGRHSAPSSPVFSKRGGASSPAPFQYAAKEQIYNASQHLRRGPTSLAMSNSSSHIQSNGYAKSSPIPFNHNHHLASSPTISPASSLCSSEMNLSQELQNHPLFKSPIVDRSLKPCHSLEPNHRITATRTGGAPPARPPPPAPHLLQLYRQQQQQSQEQSFQQQQQQQQQPPQQFNTPTYYNHPYGTHPHVEGKPPTYIPRPAHININPTVHENAINTMTTSTTTTSTVNNHSFTQQQRPLTSTPNNQYIHTTDSSYDTPPDMLSPPVPPRRQAAAAQAATLPLNSPSTYCMDNSAAALTQAVAATAAAVTAGITRLERNCWQDYAETQLLQKDSLRSSLSSSSNQSNTSSSSSSSASFVTAASRFSLYQSSPPQQGSEPPIPAPRLKKDKESLRSLQPQHMTLGLNGGTNTTRATTNAGSAAISADGSNSNASEESMKDLISLDDSHNSSFDLEDFDPLNQNARPLPPLGRTMNAHRKKSTTLPANASKTPSASFVNSTTTTTSISNPLYTFYTPQHMANSMPAAAVSRQQQSSTTPPNETPPPLPKSVPPPMPPPDEDFELLRKYGLDQFTLITTSVTATSQSATTMASATSSQPNGLTTTGMQNWTTFD